MSTSSHIRNLIAEYRDLPATGDDAANDRKVNILASLDEVANDPNVSRLLYDVLVNKSEFDLARIEAAKIVGIYLTDESPLERELKGQVWKIFLDKEDDNLVRQHASQNFEIGFGGPHEQERIAEMLFDDSDDEAVRHGAYQYVKQIKSTKFGRELIGRLLVDPYWQRYARNIDA